MSARGASPFLDDCVASPIICEVGKQTLAPDPVTVANLLKYCPHA